MVFCSCWNSVPIPVVKSISLKSVERSDDTMTVSVVLAMTLPGWALLNASKDVAFAGVRTRVTLNMVKP